jgi:AmpD protein
MSVAPHAGWPGGWCPQATRVDSPNFGPRPPATEVTLALIHSISLPPGIYGGDAIERLFTNRLDWDADPYFKQIRGAEVSAHFLIRRDGELLQFVSATERAWHAGRSNWRGRDNVNDFSLGIELEGLEGNPFEPLQYERLVTLLKAARAALPSLNEVVGHEHVAPGRKQDPGSGFDWSWLAQRLTPSGLGTFPSPAGTSPN